MSLHWFDISILVFVLLVFLYIGFRQSKKTSSVQAFFLGERNLPWWLAGTSMVATTFAADTPLLVNEIVVSHGVSGNWFWWNMLAGGMLTTFFFAAFWRRANILTDVELIQLRYSGHAAKFLRAFKSVYLGVFMNVLIIGWVNFALMSLIEVFFGVTDKWTQLQIVFASMLVVYLYSGLSGFLAVVYTDFIQFGIAMIGSIALAIIVLNSEDINGITSLKENLPAGTLSFFPSFENVNGTGLTVGVASFLTFISMPWWASWYPGAEPGGGGYIAQRMMSAKDEKHAVLSSLFFQIAHYCIRPWPWIIVALCSIVIYGEQLAGQERMGYVWVMKDYLPVGVKGLMLTAFFSAYMSTISTQLNWGSSYLVNDLYQGTLWLKLSEKKLLLLSKVSVAVILVLAVVVTSFINSINEVWSLLMSCGAGLGLVLILRWYWWRVSAWSEIVATLAPFVAYLITHYILVPNFGEQWGQDLLTDPRQFVFTVTFTTIMWIASTFVFPTTDKDVLDSFYKRIKPMGNWRVFGESFDWTWFFKVGFVWLLSIILAYSILFFLGALIFGFWTQCVLYLSLSILSAWIIVKRVPEIKVFN